MRGDRAARLQRGDVVEPAARLGLGVDDRHVRRASRRVLNGDDRPRPEFDPPPDGFFTCNQRRRQTAGMADPHQPPARLPHEKLDLFELCGGQFREPEPLLPAIAGQRHGGHRRFHRPQARERLGLEPQRPCDIIPRKAGERFRGECQRLRPEVAGQDPDAARPALAQAERGFHLRRQIVGRQAMLLVDFRHIDRPSRAEVGPHQPIAGYQQNRLRAAGRHGVEIG